MAARLYATVAPSRAKDSRSCNRTPMCMSGDVVRTTICFDTAPASGAGVVTPASEWRIAIAPTARFHGAPSPRVRVHDHSASRRRDDYARSWSGFDDYWPRPVRGTGRNDLGIRACHIDQRQSSYDSCNRPHCSPSSYSGIQPSILPRESCESMADAGGDGGLGNLYQQISL